MLHAFEHAAAASVTVAPGLLAGAVIAMAGSDVSVAAWVGGILGGAVTLGAAAAAKNWAEKQISKVIELPTKSELFEKIDFVAGSVETLKTFCTDEFRSIGESIARIDERHAMQDHNRLARGIRTRAGD